MLGEVGDPLAQDRDLDFRGTRVAVGAPVLADDLGFLRLR
jgi:hypothetical protein